MTLRHPVGIFVCMLSSLLIVEACAVYECIYAYMYRGMHTGMRVYSKRTSRAGRPRLCRVQTM